MRSGARVTDLRPRHRNRPPAERPGPTAPFRIPAGVLHWTPAGFRVARRLVMIIAIRRCTPSCEVRCSAAVTALKQ